MNTIKHINYRGYLKSCNYSCYYCPFSKNSHSVKQLKADETALNRLLVFLKNTAEKPETIFFVPYGEALIHTYYWKVLAQISSLPFIQKVGCQTNLSFNIKKMFHIFTEHGGDFQKLSLWCTFHPVMTTAERFHMQCKTLKDYNLSFCTGAVGNPDNIQEIKELRMALDPLVYLWINKMDGLKRPYTAEEKYIFRQIDPFFSVELKRKPAELTNCTGGRESVFMNGRGEIFCCNISKKKIGSLYENIFMPPICQSRQCSCYLAYCSRLDFGIDSDFGSYPAFRIPKTLH